jgi:hypothetical protein
LDCHTLQEIHSTAAADRDPFEDHLMGLLTTGMDSDVRGKTDVMLELAAIAQALDERRDETAKGRQRGFFASLQTNDSQVLNDLIHDHIWVPFVPKKATFDLNDDDINTRLAELLPFGAVLTTNNFETDHKVLLHVTQPCDLQQIRGKADQRSLLFIRGEALLSGTSKTEEGSDEVEQLRVGEKVYNMRLDYRASMSGYGLELFKWIREGKWNAAVRMRPEHARRYLHSFLNFLSRPDDVKFTYGLQNISCQFCALVNGKIIWYERGGQTKSRSVESMIKGSSLRLVNQSPAELAVWISQMVQQAGKTLGGEDLLHLANALRDGLVLKGKEFNKLNEVLCCARGVKNTEAEIEALAKGFNPKQENAELVHFFILDVKPA